MTIQNWSAIYPRFGDVIQFVNIVTITAALTWNSHIFPGVKLQCKTEMHRIWCGTEDKVQYNIHWQHTGCFMIDVWFCAGKYFWLLKHANVRIWINKAQECFRQFIDILRHWKILLTKTLLALDSEKTVLEMWKTSCSTKFSMEIQKHFLCLLFTWN